MNFKRFCALIEKYVLLPVEEEELHELYVDWKKGIKSYHFSATEFIELAFGERSLDKHGNCLKRNITKV